MKKGWMFLVLGCFAVTGVYAQLIFHFYNDFSTFGFGSVIPTGLYASPIMKDNDNQDVRNTGTPYLDGVYLTPGNGAYIPKGDISIFTPRLSARDGGKYINSISDIALNVGYYKGNFTGFISFSFYDFFNYLYMESTDRTIQNIWDWVRLGYFMVRADSRMFTFQVSNTGTPFNVDPYFDLSVMTRDFYAYGFNVLLPWPGGDRLYQAMRPGFNLQFNTNFSYPDKLMFMGTVKLIEYYLNIPVLVDLGMDLSSLSITGSSNPAQHRVNFNMVIRGNNIASLFNFDLMYRVRGGDASIDDSWHEIFGGGNQPDGRGKYAHLLSLDFGFPSLIPYLGFSAGYVAYFHTYETMRPPPDAVDQTPVKTKSPLYSGITLNIRYTGVPGLRLILNNTVIFAHALQPETYVKSYSTLGNRELFPDKSDSWFALYNAIAAQYGLGKVSAHLEAVHRMSISTTFDTRKSKGNSITDWDTDVRIKNIMMVSPYMSLPLIGGASFQAGVTFYWENSKTTFRYNKTPDFTGPQSWEGGAFAFAMPLRIVINW